MTTVRRLYFYSVAFAALLATIVGATTLLGAALGGIFGPSLVVGSSASPVALGIAMLAVGAPVWLLHWLPPQRLARAAPAERAATLRHLYLNLLLMVAATTLFGDFMALVQWLLGARGPFQPAAQGLPSLAVWSLVWGYHWRVLRSDGLPSPGGSTLHRWYLYLTATYSLVTLAFGLSGALETVLGRLYNTLFLTTVVSGSLWPDALRAPLSRILAGALWWGFHWLSRARFDTDSVLRQVYLSLVAIFGGLAALLTALGITLYQTLRYLLDTSRFSPEGHFTFLSVALPAGLVGLLVGLYHWGVLQRERAPLTVGALGVRRSYRYLVAAFALAAATGGAGILLALLIAFLRPAGELTGELTGPRWQDPLSLALALLLVGGPLWAYQWRQAQTEARDGRVGERRALARRLFLYGTLGLAILGLLGNLGYVLFRFLEQLLGASLSTQVLFDLKGNIAAVLVASGVLGYYGRVLQEDLRLGAEGVQRRKAVLLLVGSEHQELLPVLRQALPDSRLQLLEGLPLGDIGLAFPVDQWAEALARLGELSGERALVVVGGGQIRIYPYR